MELYQTTPEAGEHAPIDDNRYPELWVMRRRYGPVGFDRFDNVLSEHASIGDASIGKVKVDCKFLFEKSLWGVMTRAQNPAGIVYLDLNFQQPRDHRLKAATVTVRLDEDDDDLPKQRSTHQRPWPVPVQIGAHGPMQLTGEAHRALKTSRWSLKPHIDIAGLAGIGGVGPDSETQSVQECRWTFSSHLRADPTSQRASSAYRILEWQLTENEFETQSSHSNTVHTAFSFQHDGQPFLMHVSVQGQLQSWTSNAKMGIKNTMRKCKIGSSSPDAPCATTLINFNGRHQFSKPLDEVARGLSLAMELENMRSIPPQIPTSHRTTFREVPVHREDTSVPGSSSFGGNTTNQNALGPNGRHNLLDGVALGQNNLPTGGRPLEWLTEDRIETNDNPCVPTDRNLRDVLPLLMDTRNNQSRRSERNLSAINEHARQMRKSHYIGVPPDDRQAHEEPSKASSETLIGDEAATTVEKNITELSTDRQHSRGPVLSILHFTGVFHALHLCAIFFNLWGIDVSARIPVHKSWVRRPVKESSV